MRYVVQRLDENPQNLTFGSWVTVALFPTRETADAFVSRAAGPTQKLRVQDPPADTDPYDSSRVDETARRMLQRYSRASIAVAMAGFHALDYPAGDRRRDYWQEVRARIIELSGAKFKTY